MLRLRLLLIVLVQFFLIFNEYIAFSGINNKKIIKNMPKPLKILIKF